MELQTATRSNKLKERWQQLIRWQYLGLAVLVVVTLALHFIAIRQPAEPAFDEQHYIPDARGILAGNGTFRPEHPPVAKLFIATGMLIVGDNPVGWRIFSVIFGTISIILFYFICQRLRLSSRATMLATFLFSFENLSFTHASIAMLDVYVVTFMLLAFLLYLENRYSLSAAGIAMSALAKLTGAFGGAVTIIHWFFTGRSNAKRFLLSVLLMPVSFVFLMPFFDFAISGKGESPLARIHTMLTLSASLTFASAKHPSMSQPWWWVLRPDVMYYWYGPHYIGAISFTIWALIIPTIAYFIYQAIWKKNSAAIFGLAWVAGTYLVYIPMYLLTDRVMFVFYFLPTVGAICLGIGMGLSQLLDIAKNRQKGKLRRAIMIAVPAYFLLHLATFVILAPVFPFNIIPQV